MTPHTPEGTVGRLTREQVEDLRVRMHSTPHIDVAQADTLCDMALQSDSSAVREACAKVAENNRSWEQAGMFIAQAIRNLALPTLPAASGWVSVKERLPEDGVKVDIWVNIYASPRSMGFADADREINCWRSEGKWVHYYNAKVTEIFSDYVTHWMPIPNAPQ